MSMLSVHAKDAGNSNKSDIPNSVGAVVEAQPATTQPQQPSQIIVRSIVPVTDNQFSKQLLAFRKKLHPGTPPQPHVPPNLLVPTSNTKIMPLSISEVPTVNNQKVAYLSSVIKPKPQDTTVAPKSSGPVSAAQNIKPKVVFTPVYSHIAPGNTSNNLQSQPPKHMTNLILPVSISQLSGPASSKQNINFKPSNFTLKFNDAQIDNDQKIPMTVLCEPKTSNGSIHLPPLHPIATMNLQNASKGINSPDGVKINENPDSAVITPILKKEDVPVNLPEKRKRPISNIIRSEKRMRKQSFTKTNKDPNLLDESCYVLNSLDIQENEKDKKKECDDDITLIKVYEPQNKLPMSDEVKIEVVKNLNRNGVEVIEKFEKTYEETKNILNSKPESVQQESTKVLEWENNIATVIGTSLKLAVNELGWLVPFHGDNKGNGDKENVYSSKISSDLANPELDKIDDKKLPNTIQDDETLCDCEVCGLHGTLSDFYNKNACSFECAQKLNVKPKLRKEPKQDVQVKKGRRKLLKPTVKGETKYVDIMVAENKSDDSNDKSDKISCKTKTSSDDDSKGSSLVEEECQGDAPAKLSWLTNKNKFPWSKYLEYTKASAAPTKLFRDAFPEGKNNFKVGMKLEGIDPVHPRLYCVLTVAEVIGYRLRIHFDGYPESYDFWVNADSMNIFPVGWAEKNGRQLEPPPSYTRDTFNWPAYLKACKAQAAPKALFSNKNALSTTGFRIGMKLEAVDRKHSSQVCVASVADILGTRILIHFDSWDDVYDYWADISSPYIHPVGWCHHTGRSLTPPNTLKAGAPFVWNEYLKEQNAVAAPSRAFKQRPPCGFKRGMKFEAVDKRLPQLIRVATVEDVKDHMLKIRFDGWPESHAYWVDDDSPDIHPMGWCAKTGHPLEPPITQDNIKNRPECGTIGCKGIGHVKGPKFASHNSASGCPYSQQNIDKVKALKDRFELKLDKNGVDDNTSENITIEKEKIKLGPSDKQISSIESKDLKLGMIKQEEESSSDKSERTEMIIDRLSSRLQKYSDEQSDEEELGKKRKKMKTKDERISIMNTTNYLSNRQNSNLPDKQLRLELHESIYNPGYNPVPSPTPSASIWAKHSKVLNKAVQSSQHGNPLRWTPDEVVKFVQTIPNCHDISNEFKIRKVDGESLLSMCQDDLMKKVKLKLGPAIKIYNSIVQLRNTAMLMP